MPTYIRITELTVETRSMRVCIQEIQRREIKKKKIKTEDEEKIKRVKIRKQKNF